MAHAGGRPPYYKSVEQMQEAIDRYFADCQGEILCGADGEPMLDKYGNPIIIGAKPLTVTGLALALGFTTRLALINYEGKPEFVNAITRAKTRIEEYAESRLYDKDGANGAKFSLANNFKGWREKQEIEAKVDNDVTIHVELSDD